MVGGRILDQLHKHGFQTAASTSTINGLFLLNNGDAYYYYSNPSCSWAISGSGEKVVDFSFSSSKIAAMNGYSYSLS